MKGREGGEHQVSRRAQARRDGILDAALTVISHKGFHGTSVADVASRARVSRATVYQHFADKRDIFGALAGRIAQRIIEAADGWPDLPSDPLEEMPAANVPARANELRVMIAARITQILEVISADTDAARLIIRPPPGSNELADDALRRIGDHIVEILTRDIQEASENGLLRPCDPRTVSRFLLGGIEKLVIEALDRDEPLALHVDAIADEIGALVYSLVNGRLLAAAVG
jgi:AcrR family transcriptional regulator